MLYLRLAIRNIGRQKRRSFLTGMSMAFGFFMASLSFGLIEGTFGHLVDSFTLARTGHVQIHSGDYLERPSLYKQITSVDDVVAKVEAVSGVLSATPRVFAPALAFASDKTSAGAVIGIDPVAEAETTTIEELARTGPFLTSGVSPDGYDLVMVGASLAMTLGLEVGDDLVLIGQGADGSIANDIYAVGAVIGSKDGQERLNIYMTVDASRRFLTMTGGPDGSAHEIALIADSRDDAQDLAVRVAEALQDGALSVDPWQRVEETFYNLVVSKKQSNRVMIFIVMAMVAIGVLNAVLVSVLERTREFGLMRAVGTRPGNVFSMILVETMVLAVLACLVGLALALPALNYLETAGIPVPPVEVSGISYKAMYAEISTMSLVIPAVLVLTTAFLVSLWPAIRSSRITPVEALGAA